MCEEDPYLLELIRYIHLNVIREIRLPHETFFSFVSSGFNRGAKKNPNPQKHQSHLPPNTCPHDPHKKSVKSVKSVPKKLQAKPKKMAALIC